MVPSKHPELDEHEWKSELNDRKYKKNILMNFCDVMKSVHKLESKLNDESNQSTCYRFTHKEKRRQVQINNQSKRVKTMEPTPVSDKSLCRRSFSSSPEEVHENKNQDSQQDITDEHGGTVRSPTGLSRDADNIKLTPTQRLETSADRDVGANALMDAAERATQLKVELRLSMAIFRLFRIKGSYEVIGVGG